MQPSRGSVLIVVLITVLLAGAVVWWVDEQQTASIKAGGNQSSRDLLVEPVTGVAPLSVAFSIRRDIGTVQTIEYGNGLSANVSDFICGFQYCVRRYIYDMPGSYTATYKDASGNSVRSFTITITAKP